MKTLCVTLLALLVIGVDNPIGCGNVDSVTESMSGLRIFIYLLVCILAYSLWEKWKSCD